MGCGKSLETKEKRIHFIDDIDYRDKYEFISILGKGGFGEVRLYHKKGDVNALYAIKTIFKSGNKDIKLKYKEVEILSKLDHPNIVKYYESYEESAFIHLVMEYVNGYNLLKMISAKEIYREQDIAEIIYRLSMAISYIHTKGLVHRDIKAENILFSDCNDFSSLKLIDFGLAIESYGKERLKAGTLRYISPEMIKGKFYPKTDCWSIGVLLYFMSTGKYPFDGENIIDYIELGKYNKKLLLTYNLSQELIDLIESLIIVDIDKRLSVEEILNHDFLKIRDKDTKVINSDVIETMKLFSEKSYFDKQILYYLAKLQNNDDVKELNDLFLQFDTKNDGIISFSEFQKAMHHINKKINNPEVKKFFDDLDFNHKGFINYSQFIASVSDNLVIFFKLF